MSTEQEQKQKFMSSTSPGSGICEKMGMVMWDEEDIRTSEMLEKPLRTTIDIELNQNICIYIYKYLTDPV